MARCPGCKLEYDAYPAVSRTDNVTPICPTCGEVEAFIDFGMDPQDARALVNAIRVGVRQWTELLEP